MVFKDEYGFTYQYEKEKLVPKNASLYENIPIVKKAEPQKVTSKKHDKNPLILDLHFHLLVKNPNDYDSFERLFIQKEKLIQTINFCRKNHLKRLEIVHGIGDGVLQKIGVGCSGKPNRTRFLQQRNTSSSIGCGGNGRISLNLHQLLYERTTFTFHQRRTNLSDFQKQKCFGREILSG